MPDQKTFSIVETTRILGVGRSTLYAIIKEGRLPVRKLGKRTLVRKEDLDRFIEELPVLGADRK